MVAPYFSFNREIGVFFIFMDTRTGLPSLYSLTIRMFGIE